MSSHVFFSFYIWQCFQTKSEKIMFFQAVFLLVMSVGKILWDFLFLEFFWPQNHRISTAKNPVALLQPSKGLKAKDGGIEAKDRWGRRNTQLGFGGGKDGMMDRWMDGVPLAFFFFVWPFNPFF